MTYETSIACGNPKTNTQVEEGFSDLSKSIENLDNLLMRLGDKLCPVLRLEEAEGCAPPIPECILVPLAEELRDRRKRIDRASDQVQSWLARIEI